MEINLRITPKQEAFIKSEAWETLFGGAAGGGKSYGQLVDAMLFALKYPKSKQLILRRTYKELEKSLVRDQWKVYPREIYKYNTTTHVGTFKNGSILDFGYCDNESDVYKYQSAEYDVIRFDEATHFTEFMYLYLMSRCRGANKFPKQIKSSTNPGGVGHTFFKERFIDAAPWGEEFDGIGGKRIFIPSKVTDNKFLLSSDPEYMERLKNLPQKEKQMLLYGDWDILEGRYFTEFSRERHVIEPYEIPKEWRRFASMDYGFDMLAYLLWAVAPDGRYIVTNEIYKHGLYVEQAAKEIRELTKGLDIYETIAPKDLWAKEMGSGKSQADWFSEYGVPLTQVSTMDRKNGWSNVAEHLHFDTERNIQPRLFFFPNCVNLIRCLPALQRDQRKPEDVATEPHELTHAPDALRYGLAGSVGRAEMPKERNNSPIHRPFGVGQKIHYI